MAQQLKYTFDLNLKAYPNEMTQDMDNKCCANAT